MTQRSGSDDVAARNATPGAVPPHPGSDAGAAGRATHAAVAAAWRVEAPRLIASLARFTGDLDAAEDLAQDALVAALERWPEAGIPRRPGAWLLTTARRRAIDRFRRERIAAERQEAVAHAAHAAGVADAADADVALDDDVGDDLLRLFFICCHPVLATDARVALTLRLVGGLTTEEIARAFLVPVPTLAQRIVRAKRTLREARVPFELPPRDELERRLASVLGVVYLVFNEGYAATYGEAWVRDDLCHEAVRLARVLATLAPDEPEVHGLVALLEVQASRLRARVGPAGEPVLLADQDRGRWDRLLIRRGLAALDRAEALASAHGEALGRHALQAAIAACHARAPSTDATDWHRIVALYDALAEVAPSPVVELNRAVAVSMAFGPEAGLEIVEALAGERSLRAYHLLPAVRGDMLARLGRHGEARRAFEEAASLATNEREKALLLARASNALPGRSC